MFLKKSSEYSLFKLPGASGSNKKLKSGEILLAYPDSIYLLFKNEVELEQVFDHLKQSVSIGFSNEEIQKLIDEASVLLSSNTEDKVKNLPKSIRQEKTLEEILQIYDAEMNRYFWDNLFIKGNFAEMLGFAGIVLTEKVGGEWKYINSLNRAVFQLKTGEQLDIISYFVEEALTQKYTGYCSLEGIVSTLLLSSKLKVGRIDTFLN